MLLGALTVALSVTGCGGGDGEESVQILRSAFAEKGSAICLATRRKIRSDFEAYVRGQEGREVERAEKAGKLTAEEAAAKVGETIIVPAMRQELEELEALGAPAGDKDRVNALLTAFEEGVERAARHPERAASDGTEAFGKSGKVAANYGLEGC